ncbi:hypothetical protein ATO1_01905 [Phaeobacter sp. 22II1-1F12B]|nr:hypothetical protein ATO1_01905 [Phaeobacter sp. 22II1-1F12B]
MEAKLIGSCFLRLPALQRGMAMISRLAPYITSKLSTTNRESLFQLNQLICTPMLKKLEQTTAKPFLSYLADLQFQQRQFLQFATQSSKKDYSPQKNLDPIAVLL